MRDSNRSGSDEVREKISNSSKGKLFSEESRKKMSDAKRGRKRGPMSPETRKKISNAMKNRIGDLTLI